MKYKRSRIHSIVAGLLMMTLLGGMAGCNGITLDTTIADALSQLAQASQQDSALNQLTIGDLVQGFLQYANQVGNGSQSGAGRAMLTSDQLAQLEELQSQYDNGEITREEFAEQVHEIIGDRAPGCAFAGMGMMGGPFQGDPRTRLADELQLTDEQRQQAEEIFANLHTDLQALRQDAQDQISALLTSDQLATLEELLAQDQPPTMPHRGHRGGRMGPPPPPPADSDESRACLGPLERFADELQLTDDQETAIAQIHSDLLAAVETRHQQARDEFRAILTSEQLAILDEIEAQHEAP